MQLPDIQDQLDQRDVELDEVGVAGVRYPVSFCDGSTTQSGVASVDVTVRLPSHRRGTHMSRMIELVHEHVRDFDPRDLATVLKASAYRLDVDGVRLTVAMPMAFEVVAPASALVAWQACDVTVAATIDEGAVEVRTTVATDVTSLCPCSKAISDYGAHNQRSLVNLTVCGSADDLYPISVRQQFDMIRAVGSTPVFPIIKRVDERVVTMAAHDNPAFVEDMARDLSLACRELSVGHVVRIRNYESIHSHDAVAVCSWSI